MLCSKLVCIPNKFVVANFSLHFPQPSVPEIKTFVYYLKYLLIIVYVVYQTQVYPQTTSGLKSCLTNYFWFSMLPQKTLTKIVSEYPINHCNFKTFKHLPIITNQEVFLHLHFKQNILQ